MNTGTTTAAGDPPPAVPINHRTTTQILRQSLVSFTSSLPTIIFLSLLLFSFRSLVENGAVFVSSFIDHDPSLRSLLSRLDDLAASTSSSSSSTTTATGSHHSVNNNNNNPNFNHNGQNHNQNNQNRRRPFLHLTRVGTLDDDFFSGDDDDGRSVFGGYRKSRVNSSEIDLSGIERLGFGGLLIGNGIRVSEIVRTGVSFKIEGEVGEKEAEIDEIGSGNGVKDSNLTAGEDDEGVVDLRFFMAGLELGRRDTVALCFLIVILSGAYGWVILAFVITYSWVLGIVFVSVLNDLLGRDSSFVDSVWSGSRLGLKKLSGFVVMKWAVRDALTQVLGLWYFGEIEDQYSFLKLILRLKLMPFSATLPWIGGYQKEVSGFMFAWFMMDTAVALLFAVDSWVTIASFRRRGSEIVKEGCNLLGTMFHQAIMLKGLESIICGSALRWLLGHLCGRSVGIIFQSLAEIYFMVVWLVFYLSAKSKDASLSGRRFGRRELVGLIEGLR